MYHVWDRRMKTHDLMLRAKFNVVCKRLHILIPQQLSKPAEAEADTVAHRYEQTHCLSLCSCISTDGRAQHVRTHRHRHRNFGCCRCRLEAHTDTHTHIRTHTWKKELICGREWNAGRERNVSVSQCVSEKEREREIKITKPRVFCLLWYLALSSLSSADRHKHATNSKTAFSLSLSVHPPSLLSKSDSMSAHSLRSDNR